MSRRGARHLEQLEKSYLEERAVCGLLLSTEPQTCDTRHIGEYPVPFISVKKRVDDCFISFRGVGTFISSAPSFRCSRWLLRRRWCRSGHVRIACGCESRRRGPWRLIRALQVFGTCGCRNSLVESLCT